MYSHIVLEGIKFISHNIKNKITDNFYYLFNNTYKVPKTCIYLVLEYSDYFKNVIDYTRYFKLKEEQFVKEYGSLLSSNMIEISTTITDHGIEINIQGISTKISEISKFFLDFIFTNKKNDRESIVNFKIKKNLVKEKYAQSYKRLFQKLRSLVINNYKLADDLLTDFDTSKDLNIKQFKYKLFVIGNIPLEDAECIENVVIKNQIKSNIIHNTLEIKPCTALVNTYDITNNACGLFYFCNKSTDLKNKVIGSFIINSVSEIFFDQLRTNEEFGYVVSANMYSVLDTEFLYFVVQSERETDEIKRRIFKFIEFTKKYIREMGEDEFLSRKESLVDCFSETYKNLNSYSYFLYKTGITGCNGLTYKNEMVDFTKKLTLEDVINSKIFEEVIVISTSK